MDVHVVRAAGKTIERNADQIGDSLGALKDKVVGGKPKVDKPRENNAEGFEVPNTVTRQDNDFSSPTFFDSKGRTRDKSFIEENGVLRPVDPDGNVSIQSQVRGGANNSQLTSTTAPGGPVSPKKFGDKTVEINTRELQKLINRGGTDVVNTKIITPQEIQKELSSKVDTAKNDLIITQARTILIS
jgi:hypothetical protein